MTNTRRLVANATREEREEQAAHLRVQLDQARSALAGLEQHDSVVAALEDALAEWERGL